jgi:hypothetical protein
MATYYVSSSGSDSNSGTSSSPWQTLSKVNGAALASGDTVLFNRDDVFYGQLVPKNGVTYNAYGSGEKPVISGFVTLTGWADEGNGIYSVALSSTAYPVSPKFLLIDGVRKYKGRYPKNTFFKYTGGPGYITSSEITTSPNWVGGSICVRMDNNHVRNFVVGTQTSTSSGYKYTTQGYTSTVGQTNGQYGFFFLDHEQVLNTSFNKNTSGASVVEYGDWAYKNTGTTVKLYVYFGANGPSGKKVQTTNSGANDVVSMGNTKSTINLSNLIIEGASGFGITSGGAVNNVTIQNCDVRYCDHGIRINSGVVNWVIKNCSLRNLTSVGLIMDGTNNTDTTFEDNIMENVGLEYATMRNDNIGGVGVFYMGDGFKCLRNRISNTGLNGISIRRNNFLIENNLVESFNMRKDDGGGIYMYDGAVDGQGEYISKSITLPLNISTITLTVKTNQTKYVQGDKVIVYQTNTDGQTGSGYNHFSGTIQSYTSSTGQLVISVEGQFGNITSSSWAVMDCNTRKDRTIRGNIVRNGVGQKNGWLGGSTGVRASGIYLDDRVTNVLVENNITLNNYGYSFFLHHAATIEARNNIFFQDMRAGLRYEHNHPKANPIRFNNVHDNVIINTLVPFVDAQSYTDSTNSSITMGWSEIKNQGILNKNTYLGDYSKIANPFKWSPKYTDGTTTGTFDKWKSVFGHDKDSTFNTYNSATTRIEYNETNAPKNVSLGTKVYKNLVNSTAPLLTGTITLAPFESIALLETTGSVTPTIPTVNPPTITSTALSTASITASSLTLSWTQAATTLSPSTLTYYVYASTANNITTLATTEANGTLVGIAKNTSSLSISNLEPSTTYYFNIIVSDELGNKSLYAAKSQTTAAAAQLMPVPGGSQDTWGTVLNSYLLASHNDDGTLKASPIASKLFGTTSTTNIDILGELRVQQATTLLSQYNQSLYSTTSASVTPINFTNGTVKVVLTTNTILLLGNAVPGGIYTLILQQDGTGGRSITWPSYVKWNNTAPPTINSAANSVTLITFVYDGVSFFGKVGSM